MTMISMYTPIGWGRRAPGHNTVYRDTLRHLRDPNHGDADPRTLCGRRIPVKALRQPPQGMFFGTVIAMTPQQVEQQAPCHRCYARAGLKLRAGTERTQHRQPQSPPLPLGSD